MLQGFNFVINCEPIADSEVLLTVGKRKIVVLVKSDNRRIP